MLVSSRPALGNWRFRRDAPRLLMVTFWDPCGISTIPEYIAAWQNASQFNIAVLNLFPHSGGALAIPESVDLDEFDGVILHPTVTYFPSNLFNLDSRAKKFDVYGGVKILVKQDEHVQSACWADFISMKRFDVLVTCLPPAEVRKVYPQQLVGNVVIVHALTGYVPQHFRDIVSPSLASRAIDISYRGSMQPLAVGRLGFEKRQVGYSVLRASVAENFRMDISSRWEDRITGPAWFEFLASSRIVLGSESGSCLFDFDGSVDLWCQNYTARNGDLDPAGEEFYRRAHEEFLHRYEGNVDNATISPRHFEAAATRSIQLLYEGRYGGILEPYRHFLPLKRDLSNLGELLDLARDERRMTSMTEAAFEEIVLANRFSYEHWISEMDAVIDGKLAERGPRRAIWPVRSDKRCALVAMSHDPVLDPRIDWMSKGLVQQGYQVVELGFYRFNEVGPGPRMETLSDGRKRVRVERTRHDFAFVPNPGELRHGLSIGQQILLSIYSNLKAPERARRSRIGAVDLDHGADKRFRFFCEHFIDTNSALIQAARQIGQFDIIVAVDLDVLPAAETLAKEWDAVLIYDAHEYWPQSRYLSRHWEREFWAGIEHALVPEADIRVTVSPPLAQQLSQDYGVTFSSLPNCEWLSSAQFQRRIRHGKATIFLYQGNFVQGRNLERLILEWSKTSEDAILWLRGPGWSYKQELMTLAQTTGLLGSRIFFPDPVPESELVEAAAQADVGIICYDQNDNNNRFACPNKFSQYLAAGLPILATDLKFVATIVRDNGIGAVFSFDGHPSLSEAVSCLQDQTARKAMSERCKTFFTEQFNWEVVSREFYAGVARHLEHRRRGGELDFSWIVSGRTMRQASGDLNSDGGQYRQQYRGSLALRMLERVPKHWRKRIRRRLPERLVSRIMTRL